MALIDWSEPIFHDNSITPLNVVRTPKKLISFGGAYGAFNSFDGGGDMDGMGLGVFPIGETTTIMYVAIDESGNNSTCILDINVQGDYAM